MGRNLVVRRWVFLGGNVTQIIRVWQIPIANGNMTVSKEKCRKNNNPPIFATNAARKHIVSEFQDLLVGGDYSLCFKPLSMESALSIYAANPVLFATLTTP